MYSFATITISHTLILADTGLRMCYNIHIRTLQDTYRAEALSVGGFEARSNVSYGDCR